MVAHRYSFMYAYSPICRGLSEVKCNLVVSLSISNQGALFCQLVYSIIFLHKSYIQVIKGYNFVFFSIWIRKVKEQLYCIKCEVTLKYSETSESVMITPLHLMSVSRNCYIKISTSILFFQNNEYLTVQSHCHHITLSVY